VFWTRYINVKTVNIVSVTMFVLMEKGEME